MHCSLWASAPAEAAGAALVVLSSMALPRARAGSRAPRLVAPSSRPCTSASCFGIGMSHPRHVGRIKISKACAAAVLAWRGPWCCDGVPSALGADTQAGTGWRIACCRQADSFAGPSLASPWYCSACGYRCLQTTPRLPRQRLWKLARGVSWAGCVVCLALFVLLDKAWPRHLCNMLPPACEPCNMHKILTPACWQALQHVQASAPCACGGLHAYFSDVHPHACASTNAWCRRGTVQAGAGCKLRKRCML